MSSHVPTLTDHILKQKQEVPYIDKSFALLLVQIENAAKVIASHVKASGLVDILGETGAINTFGETVQKLDDFSNELLTNTLLNSSTVHAIVSEEMGTEMYASKKHAGDYIVYFDPLDGSSNIETNCPIGTIFSIYHKKDGILQPGEKQIAAGYIIYGTSVIFVYSIGAGVHGFTLDPAIGSFLLSYPSITIPKRGKIYSINEAYTPLYDDSTKKYLQHIKADSEIKARYVGSLVADAHRTFLKGGIFLYPSDKKQPQGKLRLMIEVNPFAFLTKHAGGKIIGAGGNNPLNTFPSHIHERSPFIMGSEENIDEYKSFL